MNPPSAAPNGQTQRHPQWARTPASGRLCVRVQMLALVLGSLLGEASADPMKPLAATPSASSKAAPVAPQGHGLRPLTAGGPPPSASPGHSTGLPALPAQGAAGSLAAGLPAAQAGEQAAPEPRLFALRQNSSGQWHALFEERWVHEGHRLGASVVVSINSSRVRLRQGRTERDIHLLPQLQAALPPGATTSSKARTTGSTRP